MSDIGAVLGVVGGSAAVIARWPQVWRLWVERRHIGLSLTTSVLGWMSGLEWSAYGAAHHRLVQVLANLAVAVSASALLAGQVVVGRVPVAVWLPRVVGGGTFVVVAWRLAPVTALGVIATAITLSMAVPQIAALIRRRRTGLYDASGVAVGTWIVMAVGNIAWIGYGVTVHDLTVLLANVAIMTMSSMVLLTLRRNAALAQVGMSVTAALEL